MKKIHFNSKYHDILTKDFLIQEYVTLKKSTYQIAEQVGCTQPTVRNYLIKYNIKIRTRSESHGINPTLLTKTFLVEEYIKNKKTCVQIANEINCHYTTIARWLKKYNTHIKTHSESLIGKYKGKDSPSWKEHKASAQKYYCIEPNCNNRISYNNWRDGQGRCNPCANKRTRKLGLFNLPTKENHWHWKKDKSFEPYPLGWTKVFKETIRERDNRKCQICDKLENGHKLDVHHIDYDKENLDPENLISLCKSCHMKTNFNREIYIEYFKNLSKEKVYVNN